MKGGGGNRGEKGKGERGKGEGRRTIISVLLFPSFHDFITRLHAWATKCPRPCYTNEVLVANRPNTGSHLCIKDTPSV